MYIINKIEKNIKKIVKLVLTIIYLVVIMSITIIGGYFVFRAYFSGKKR